MIPAIRRVADRNGLTVVDLHAVITDEMDMTSDMIHPNDKGSALMARAVADAIESE